MKNLLLFFAITILFTNIVKSQDLGSFGADLGKKSVFGKEIRIPYTDLISFYGFMKPGITPDEEKGGKKYFYLYLWIPVASPEIGIRMVSPVTDMKPEKGDFVMEEFTANQTDKTSYFDTWISFEKAGGVTSIDEILTKGKDAVWTSIMQNDDSGEMPKQPSGNYYNSLMRMTSEVSNPLKALTIGLYRIGFTTYKTGEVKGSFLAQIGSVVKIPGMMVSRNLDTLKALITK
jgi:hypothetical protein